jgi:flagellar biosynthesis/type III secretory pathway protein FliH
VAKALLKKRAKLKMSKATRAKGKIRLQEAKGKIIKTKISKKSGRKKNAIIRRKQHGRFKDRKRANRHVKSQPFHSVDYNKGYDKGYDEGYDQGFSQGYNEGNEQGQEDNYKTD